MENGQRLGIDKFLRAFPEPTEVDLVGVVGGVLCGSWSSVETSWALSGALGDASGGLGEILGRPSAPE